MSTKFPVTTDLDTYRVLVYLDEEFGQAVVSVEKQYKTILGVITIWKHVSGGYFDGRYNLEDWKYNLVEMAKNQVKIYENSLAIKQAHTKKVNEMYLEFESWDGLIKD